MVGVGGAQLELDEGGHTLGQVIEQQLEGRSGSVGGVAGKVGREVYVVRHAVAVVIAVEEIGRAIAVHIGRDLALLAARVPLDAVAQAVLVGVHLQRVGVPHFAVVGEAGHFVAVGNPVVVRVFPVGVGAQDALGAVGQAIVVIVACVIGVAVGGRIGVGIVVRGCGV